jgi:hypothetical protein
MAQAAKTPAEMMLAVSARVTSAGSRAACSVRATFAFPCCARQDDERRAALAPCPPGTVQAIKHFVANTRPVGAETPYHRRRSSWKNCGTYSLMPVKFR